jgi:hypothetical protein
MNTASSAVVLGCWPTQRKLFATLAVAAVATSLSLSMAGCGDPAGDSASKPNGSASGEGGGDGAGGGMSSGGGGSGGGFQKPGKCKPASGGEIFNGKDDDCDGQVDEGDLCSDGNACNGTESCQSGACEPGTAPDCQDSNHCTVDSCDPTKGCAHEAAKGGTCDDGDACTGCELPAGVKTTYLATAAANCPESQWSGCNAFWM